MSNVAYYFDDEIGTFFYGQYHPMKPLRMKITHEMLRAYEVLPKLKRIIPEDHEEFVKKIDFTKFHTDEYIDFLMNVTPENMSQKPEQIIYYSIGEDCPIFEGLGEFCRMSGTGSVLGAHFINEGWSDVSINWSGGLHHAKRNEAIGFCYLNDCVLAILELLTHFQRVMYIDIDVHHGDGVEEAFYLTNRCMTLSFHRFGDFFPGTGSITDIGEDEGMHYAMNVPLKKGIDDENYIRTFKIISREVIERYRPNAIVMQCGADSISYDKLGDFCLTVKGHGECVRYIKSFGIPMMLLGGGGYTIENVSRCWTYETGVALDEDLPNEMPITDYYTKYGPEYKLHQKPANHPNLNEKKFLDELIEYNIESLKALEAVPNIDNNLPQDFLEELKKMPVGDLNLTRSRDHPSEFDDNGNGK